MELCNCRAISNLPCTRRRFLPELPPPTTISLRKRTLMSHRNPVFLNLVTPATNSEDSIGINGQFEKATPVVATVEEPSDETITQVDNEATSVEVSSEGSPFGEQFQMSEFLDKLDLKLDVEDTYSLLVYGSGALIALWLASAVVGAIDSIPVVPKILEIVGLSYTVWFISRYLVFKKNRDELSVKIEELKQQIIGSADE